MINAMKYPKWFLILAFLVLLVYSPILLLSQDYWDGDIMVHAFDTQNFDIYKNWFNEAGLHFLSILYDVFRFADSGEEYKFFASSFQIVFLILIGKELGFISKILFNLEDKGAFFVALSLVLSPVWANIYSTIYVLHVFTIFLSLYVVRLFLQREFKWWHYILIAISFQHSSNTALIFSLIASGFVLVDENRNKNYLKEMITLFLIGTVYFFSYRVAFPAYGLYANYNQISFSNVFNFVGYSYFMKQLYSLYAVVFSILIVRAFIVRDIKLLLCLFFIVLVTIANLVPYIAVGKYTNDLIHGFSSRFMFQAILPMSFLFGLLSKCEFGKNTFISRSIIILLFIISLVPIVHNLYLASESKLNVAAYKKELENKIRSSDLDSGCVIYLRFPSGGRMTSYVINKMFYNDDSGITSLPIVVPYYSKEEYEIAYLKGQEDNLRKSIMNNDYRDKYILPEKFPSCYQNVEVEVNFGNINKTDFLSKVLYLSSDKVSDENIDLKVGDVYIR